MCGRMMDGAENLSCSLELRIEASQEMQLYTQVFGRKRVSAFDFWK